MFFHIFRAKYLGDMSMFSGIVLLSLIGCQQADLGHSKASSAHEVVQAAIAEELNMEVLLKVETFRQNDEWAFLSGLPLTTDGKPIDYSQTKFANDILEGYFDDGFVALTKKTSIDVSDWDLIALSLGATDAPFVDWPEKFGAPKYLIMP